MYVGSCQKKLSHNELKYYFSKKLRFVVQLERILKKQEVSGSDVVGDATVSQSVGDTLTAGGAPRPPPPTTTHSS